MIVSNDFVINMCFVHRSENLNLIKEVQNFMKNLSPKHSIVKLVCTKYLSFYNVLFEVYEVIKWTSDPFE